MQITYDVPDDLLPYLEPIPSDLLQDFITEAIRKAVERNEAKETVAPAYADVLAEIKNLVRSTYVSEEVSVAVPEPEPEPQPQLDIRALISEDSDDEDFDFLAAILK